MAEYVKGTLACPNDKIIIKSSTSDKDLLEYFTYSFLITEMLNTSLSKDENLDDNVATCQSLALDAFDKAEKLSEIIYTNAVNETFLGHFNIVSYSFLLKCHIATVIVHCFVLTLMFLQIKNFTELLHYQNLSDNTTLELLRQVGSDNVQETKKLMLKKASEQGWLWCIALKKVSFFHILAKQKLKK